MDTHGLLDDVLLEREQEQEQKQNTDDYEERCHLLEVPNEVKYMILDYLSTRDLVNLTAVCGSLREFAQHLLKFRPPLRIIIGDELFGWKGGEEDRPDRVHQITRHVGELLREVRVRKYVESIDQDTKFNQRCLAIRMPNYCDGLEPTGVWVKVMRELLNPAIVIQKIDLRAFRTFKPFAFLPYVEELIRVHRHTIREITPALHYWGGMSVYNWLSLEYLSLDFTRHVFSRHYILGENTDEEKLKWALNSVFGIANNAPELKRLDVTVELREKLSSNSMMHFYHQHVRSLNPLSSRYSVTSDTSDTSDRTHFVVYEKRRVCKRRWHDCAVCSSGWSHSSSLE